MFKKASFLPVVALLMTGPFSSALFAMTLTLDYSTYLGGSAADYGQGISAGSDGTAYVVGHTYSSNFPMVNAYQSGYQVMEKN